MVQHQLYAVKSKPIIYLSEEMFQWLENHFSKSDDDGFYYVTKEDFYKAMKDLSEEQLKDKNWKLMLRGIKRYLTKEGSSIDLAIWT